MSAEIIDFSAKRYRLKDGFEPISQLLAGDECIMDETNYPDPPLSEYLKSAGYSIDTGEVMVK